VLAISVQLVFSLWGFAIMADVPPGAPRDHRLINWFLLLSAILLIAPPTLALGALLYRGTRRWHPLAIAALTLLGLFGAIGAILWVLLPLFVRL
jgi:hypothetical protein